MNVRVPSAKDGAGRPRQQSEAVKIITPGPSGQQQNDIGNEVAQNVWIRRDVTFAIGSETAQPKICKPKHQRAAQGEQDETDLNEVQERQDEQVEANVARVDGIWRAEILSPN